MTVAVNDTIERYTITGAGPYAYTWRIFNDTDLQVHALSSASPPVPTLLTYLTHYTVAGANAAAGGSITLTAAALAAFIGYTLDIRANTPEDQPTSIRNQARFLPEIHEDAFDYLSRQVQDLSRRVDASFRYPDNEILSGQVPSAAARKGFFLFWDTLTGALTTALISSVTMTQSLIGQLLNPQTPAEAAAGVVPVNHWNKAGNVLRYGTNTTPGTTDMTTAIQAALNQRAQGGARIYVPAGTYRHTAALSYPLSLTPLYMYGDGQFASVITTALNIENLTNAGADATHGLPDPVIHDLSFYNTFPVTAGAGSTSFNVHLKNPLNARIRNVYFKSNFADTDFNANNHAGIWLDKVGGYGAAFQNLITGCWIQNGQILMGTSDSEVTECICWGHPCDYAIKLDSTNIAVQNCYDLTGSRNHGAVWLTVNATLCRVQGNFFDGAQGAINSGYGVWGDAQLSNSIQNNTFWTMTKAAIWLVDPQMWNVSGNVFQNCGSQSLSTDDSDVVLNATSIATNNNVCNNTHLRTDVRAVSAYAIFEKNSGAAPQVNRYIGNQIADSTGQYPASAINLAAGLYNQQSLMLGNAGKSVATEFSGQYTGTLTGCATAPTATLNYTRQGNMMAVYCPALAAVSNTTACTITGMPAAIRPTNTARGFAFVTTNGVATFGAWAIDNTGVITLYVANSSTGFAAVGNKGVIDGLTLIYPLN
jgi:hypothetical protein